ncbi:hydroxyectoine utilization dehydratase EutB [Marinobacterium zhoushanense]|uniref:Hydroxyectoine utilization dehydratase EutB n=1 Tax=Marinobacterium zhoushanense TaxID=1679163 RepID=A0ABQ1KW18_9GAMM|nr:hydroxyectoine utilization dehydratase EutB [Marinobacterium zhoushanense]GGC09244.1 hydroxyectoine utilization dehydratase EutB [Marinobacterium zhoushanense]
MKLIELAQVYRARRAIAGRVTRTPLIPALSLSDARTEVRLKLETTQPTGAFKLRGAVNALANLTAEQRDRGVVCASTGNHGRALAWAARQLGVQATICMSALVPDNKVEAIRRLGADIRIHGNSQDEAQKLVAELVTLQEMVEIPPFDHADIIAGQGTIGLEILEEWPEVDTLIVGLSGGGLLSGVALAAKAIKPGIRVIGVSPARGAAMAASLDSGQPVEVEELATLADSLGGGIGLHNRFTFAHVRKLMDEYVLLEEIEIARSMRHLYREEQLVVEGAGALGAALLLEPARRSALAERLGQRIAIIVSGRNVDMDSFTAVVDGTHKVWTTPSVDK